MLRLSRRRDRGGDHGRDSAGRRGGAFVVVEQQRCQRPTQVPLNVVDEYAQEDVRPHPAGQAVVERPDLELGRLEAAEGALHRGQALVGEHGGGRSQRVGRHRGAQDPRVRLRRPEGRLEAVERRLLGERGLITREAQVLVGDGEAEVLGHLAPAQHGADPKRDRVLARERAAGTPGGGPDFGQILLGRRQQRLARAAPLGGEVRVAADDQALARIVGRGDLGQIPLMKQ